MCVLVSDNHNTFVLQSPGSGYGYRAYVKLQIVPFFSLFAAKDSKNRSLFVVENLENYTLSNHSACALIKEEYFLDEVPVRAALDKLTSRYLRLQFQNSARHFLEHFNNTVLSTVANLLRLGRWVSRFCPEINLGGN